MKCHNLRSYCFNLLTDQLELPQVISMTCTIHISHIMQDTNNNPIKHSTAFPSLYVIMLKFIFAVSYTKIFLQAWLKKFLNAIYSEKFFYSIKQLLTYFSSSWTNLINLYLLTTTGNTLSFGNIGIRQILYLH